MFTLNNNHHGKRVILNYQPRNSGTIPIKGRIAFHGGAYYVCHNHPQLNGSSNALNTFGAYILAVPQDLRRISEYVTNVLSIVEDLQMIIYFKQTENGARFRRIYKVDGPMTFVGPLQKDIEDCKLPSAVITVIDTEHMEKSGWAVYEKEPTAEERVKQSPKGD